jgi:hypothetical protein
LKEFRRITADIRDAVAVDAVFSEYQGDIAAVIHKPLSRRTIGRRGSC